MGTTRDLINASFRTINVLGEGNQNANAAQLKNALYALDTLTDSWSNERLMIFKLQPFIFPIVPGKQVYTMGPQNLTPGSIVEAALPFVNYGGGYVNGTYTNVPVSYVTSGTGSGAKATVTIQAGVVINVAITEGGINYLPSDNLTVATSYLGGGSPSATLVFQPQSVTTLTDWVIDRPMKIEMAYTIYNPSGAAQQVDIPITLLTAEQYASIGVKQTPSNFSFDLYDDGDYPQRNITLFPIPNQAGNVRLWLRQPLVDATMAALDTPVDFPPGYEEAFRYNLAVELSFEYGKGVPELVMQKAIESKAKIARLNANPMYKKGDGGMSNNKQGWFNFITGGFEPFKGTGW
jgi:hypothetical protein